MATQVQTQESPSVHGVKFIFHNKRQADQSATARLNARLTGKLKTTQIVNCGSFEARAG